MIGGQYRDVRPHEALDAAGLERTSRLKTGALIGASAACGAIVAGAGEGEVGTARAFGTELGLLFQIVDDVLDETGSDEALGKSAGTDARRGRRTFASELGLTAPARAPTRASAARGRCSRRFRRPRMRPWARSWTSWRRATGNAADAGGRTGPRAGALGCGDLESSRCSVRATLLALAQLTRVREDGPPRTNGV